MSSMHYICKMPHLYSEYRIDGPNSDRVKAYVRSEILKPRFIELFMQTGHIGKTCQILGMVPRTLHHWKSKDPEFAAEFEMAERVALMLLEDAAVERAMYGIEKPVYQGGKLAGYVREYSDTLLIVLLKARAPHKYKERFSGELTGPDGKPLLNDFTINHVHSQIPIAETEDQITYEIKKSTVLETKVIPQDAPPSDDNGLRTELSEEDLLGS